MEPSKPPSFDRPVPWPQFNGAHVLQHDAMDEVNGGVCVAMMVRFPPSVLFQNFLSPEDCANLIMQAEPKLNRSTAINDKSGTAEVHETRTSQGMFFRRGETELIEKIERRIAEVCNWPVHWGEGLQVLKYGPGELYQPQAA